MQGPRHQTAAALAVQSPDTAVLKIQQLEAANQALQAQHNQHEAVLQQLQDQHEAQLRQLSEQHEADMAVAPAMAASCNSSSDQFTYCVRGSRADSMQGSVPRSIFGAEPTSVLARMMNPEWQTARDDQGRALVNSDPSHWPLILNWLSFGALPDASSVTSAFLAECRYWQLDNLLEQLEASKPPTAPAEPDIEKLFFTEEHLHDFTVRGLDAANGRAFILEGHVCNFLERRATSSVRLEFRVYGALWRLSFRKSTAKVSLCLLEGLPQTCSVFRWWLGPDARLGCFKCLQKQFVEGGNGYGRRYMPNDATPFQGMVDLAGNLKVKLEVTLRNP